jgi:hypothetical protein
LRVEEQCHERHIHRSAAATSDGKGSTLYTLRLSAWGESVSASFTQRDLRDLREVRWSLRNLWDDLLRLKIEQSLKNLSKGSDGA